MGCGLSKAHIHPEVLVSHGNARTDRPRSAADRPAASRPAGSRPTSPRRWASRASACGPGSTASQTEGEAGLADRSSRPHSQPDPDQRPRSRTASSQLRARAARAARTGSAPSSACPPRTVSRVLRRRGMPWLRELDPMTGEVIRSSKQTAVRYERSRPGELVHMDVKKLGRIPDGGGWRAHGRGGRPTTARHKHAPIGYDYVHSLVDDHSRLAYSEILPDEKGATCAAFLDRAAAYFAAHGIARDRAGDDRQRLGLPLLAARASAPQLGAPAEVHHARTAPGRTARSNASTAPWPPNGPTGRSSPATTERAAALAPWLEHYNTQRRHSALGGLPPISRLPPT